jgi:hypothetical protein
VTRGRTCAVRSRPRATRSGGFAAVGNRAPGSPRLAARLRTGALVALASLLVLALVTAPPAPAAPAQADPADPADAAIDLVGRSRWVAPEDQAVFFITTSGDTSTATVQVEVFSALRSVEDLEESATEDVGVRLSLSEPVAVAALPPGPDGTRAVGIPVSAEQVDGATVQIVEPGVHPVVISLLDENGQELDQIRTPVVRLGDDTADWDAPDLAVLLDVAATPSLHADGTRAIDPGELRRLAQVGSLLEAHPDLGLSVAVLPDTIDALGTLSDPAATALVERLTGRELLSVPYLPVPVATLVDEGLRDLVAPLVERGDALLADRLAATTERRAWTGTGELGTEGARLLIELGFDSVVVEAAPVVEDDDGDDDGDLAPLVDSGPRPVDDAGALAGLLVDPALSDELATSAGDQADAAHIALARLLLRPVEDDPDEDDDESTTVLVRPHDLAVDSVLVGLLAVLDDPASPVRVGGLDLVDTLVDEDVEPVERVDPSEPDLGDVAPRVLVTVGQLDSFQSLIGPQSSRADDLRLQIATALATTTPSARRGAAMDTVEEVLGSAFASVRLSGERNLNLTSRQGTLPVTVENGNPFPVEVVIRTASDRLRFPAGEDLPVTVAPGDAVRVDVAVEALATGSVPVAVELWTPDHRIRLDGRQLNVRSTAISGVGLLLSLGALLVLVVWWVRSWRRTRRAPAADSGPAADSMG